MMKRLPILVGLLSSLLVIFNAATPTGAAALLTHAPRIHEKGATTSSTNWSGYAVETNFARPQNGAVTDAKGSWVVPAVSQTSTDSYSAIWVGIDGYSSNSVEQLGTEQDWVGGKAVYSAWWEMYPYPSHTIGNLKVSPGDKIQAEVKYNSNGSFTLTLTDKNSGTFTTTVRGRNAQRSSAEWIVEAPWMGGVLPLADFGTASFDACQATLNGHTGGISDSAWQNQVINMVNSKGSPKATPSTLGSGGAAFSVTWNASN